MTLQSLIHELQSLLPVLGPNAPVLQHERLRISNDRDCVQVIDPDDKVESDLVTSLRAEIAELEELPSAESEIERAEDDRRAAESKLEDALYEADDLIKAIEAYFGKGSIPLTMKENIEKLKIRF